MDPLIGSTLIGSGLSLIGGLIGNSTNASIAKQNIQAIKETNSENIAFQKAENELTRQREDNAVLRSAIDMRNAGLSKTLAAGNSASAQSLTAPHSNTPINEFKYESALQKMNIASVLQDMAYKQKQLDIQNKLADSQVDLNEAQGFKFRQEASTGASQAKYYDALTAIKETEGLYTAQQIETDIQYSIRRIQSIIADTKLTDSQREKVIEETAKVIAETNHLGKETEYLVSQMLTEELKRESLQLDIDTADWNLGQYKGLGIPTGSLGAIGKDANLLSKNVYNVFDKMSFGLYGKLDKLLSNFKLF